jgi:hypothetical protein
MLIGRHADGPAVSPGPRRSELCSFASATMAELEAAAAFIPGPVNFHRVERGDNGLRGRDGEMATVVAA